MSSGFRKLIFLIVLLGVVYVSFQYMIKPANKSLAEQKVRVQNKVAKLTQLEEAKTQMQGIDEQVEELQKALTFFESKLPPGSEIHKVLKQITIIALQHGLNPKTVQTMQTKQCNGYIEQPLKLEVEGDFLSYYAFLTDLERLDRITRIRDFDIKKVDKKEGQTSATFTVSVFFQDSIG